MPADEHFNQATCPDLEKTMYAVPAVYIAEQFIGVMVRLSSEFAKFP